VALMAMFAFGLDAAPQDKPKAEKPKVEKPKAKEEAPDPSKFVFPVKAGNSVSIGPENAPVTLITFLDYQCPFCSRFGTIQKQIHEEYGDKVRFVIKQFPLSFHKGADTVAEAALAAADQNKAWEMHVTLLENIKSLAVPRNVKPEDLPAEIEKLKTTLTGFAADKGLDKEKFKAALDSGTLKDRVNADLKDAKDVRIMATPSTFINGRLVMGARPFEDFKAIIEDELKWAKKGQKPPLKQAALVTDVIKPRQPKAQSGPDPNKRYPINIENAGWMGAKDASVTVVSYLDYQ
ncbi:DsbA family protein, partial [Acidobacteriota bacterium]